MWSHAVLCLLVGLAYATNNPGWTDNQEYVYKIRGRTLTGLMEVSDRYAGVQFRAILRIQPKSDGQKLQALLTNPEYAQIHSELSEGWRTTIPEEDLSWKPIAMSQKPFQIQMENGKIVNLIVSKEVKNWEANMIKGIASVFQLNVNGENSLPRSMNVLPSDNSNNAVFYAMEDTVSGETETLYEIRPMPEHLVDISEESEKIFEHLKQDGEVIEVIKNKNFSRQNELPSYAQGFGDYLTGGNAASTKMGEFFSRDSTSRAILLGNLRKYTVLNSSTVETILVSPTITDQQKAAVISFIGANLKEVKSQDEQIGQVPEPVPVGNLVYTYNLPFAQDDQARPDQRNKHGQQQGDDLEYDDESRSKYSGAYNRFRKPRSLGESSGDESDDEYYYTQDQPEISRAPKTPFVPYTTGYEGKSIKKAVNIIKEAEKIAKKIGSEMKDSERDHHEKTLERFSTLTSLIRLMDVDEIKEISQKLYSQAEEGSGKATWNVLRDAVAESGTPPALLMIASWIDSDEIQGEEAAQVVSTMAKSARQPTLEYMKSFFKLTKKEKVLRQWPLNDTAIVSFAHLARAVYVDEKLSKTEFPVKAFGPFCTEEGKRFVREEVIPHLTEMLKKSVQRAETHKIHVYTHALGQIAAPEVLAAFEPYLEGKEQASEFQRFLMVLSLGKLTEVHPDRALAVLFRIYQNPAEHPAVRIAAIAHIMRSRPSADILQVMAQNTNIEQNEHVNAFVKHSIEELTDLEGEEFDILRENAKVARPLLTTETYGLNHGRNYLRTYMMDELKKNIKSSIQFFPSEDQYAPNGMRYTWRGSWAGLNRKLFKLQALTSSFDQLVDVLSKQTKSYKQQQKQQEQHAQEQGQYPWSPQNIAKIMNIKADEREQLEGFLSLEFGAPHRIFGFDNNTIEQLPKLVQDMEKALREGKNLDTYKFVQYKERVLAFPTAMGVPFVYHLTNPMLLKVQGEITAATKPQLSSGDSLQTPEQVQIESEMRITVSGKCQGRVTFTTPFDHQKYVSGFDKHWEINLPKIKTQMKADWNQKELEIEIEPQHDSKINIFHYRTWPYTAKTDILNFEPLTAQAAQKNVKETEPENMHGFKTVYGEKSTGIALEIEVNHERSFMHLERIRRVVAKNGLVYGALELWDDGYIQNSQIDVTYLPEKSSVKKITLRSKYDDDYFEKAQPKQPKWVLDEKEEPAERQGKMMKAVSAEIENAEVYALDTTIKFEGERKIQYLLTGAGAKSNVDPKSLVRICFKKSSDDKQKDYEAHLVATSRAENVNGMDLENSLQEEPRVESEVTVLFGKTGEQLSKLKAKLQHTRSEERKRYLKDSLLYKQSKKEMKEGNKALDASTRMNMFANLLDRAEIKIEHENLKPAFEETIKIAFEDARFRSYPNLHIQDKQTQAGQNEVLIKVNFHSDLKYFNATVQTPREETLLTNIAINPLTRQIVVPHPVLHLRARVLSYIYGIESYREFCTVDQTKVNTFSNRTFDADISKQWTVMALYAPKEAREDGQSQQQESLAKQLKTQLENFVVLVRESKESQDKKDVKIVVSSPETDYQIVDIEMKPAQGEEAKGKVTINGKPVEVSQEQSHDAHKGYIQIYALRNGEVKIEIRDAFYIIYDGERVKMVSVSGKLKDATRGICGQHNDQDAEDFLTSENCFARKPQAFVKSFEVEGEQGQQIRKQFAGDDNQCVDQQGTRFVNVITKSDYSRWDSEEEEDQQRPGGHRTGGSKYQGRQCLTEQTRYIQHNNEICFTTVPVPSCKSNCQADSLRNKQIGVHCVKKSNVADLWKNQIDNGGSPDFSNKKQHKTVQMPVPESCSY